MDARHGCQRGTAGTGAGYRVQLRGAAGNMSTQLAGAHAQSCHHAGSRARTSGRR